MPRPPHGRKKEKKKGHRASPIRGEVGLAVSARGRKNRGETASRSGDRSREGKPVCDAVNLVSSYI